MRGGVVVFPGSNCDHDCYYASKEIIGADTEFLWYKDRKKLDYLDFIILPGGFSYGDYLRPGAIAKLSPLMDDIYDFAEKEKIIIGICNGFQILTEAQLLPGMLMRNENIKFICKYVNLKVENNETIFTKKYNKKQIISMPIAHADGNYYADKEVLEELERNNQIVFKYCDKEGNISKESNPNGSLANIAGIINKKGNILGMMPHPERNAEVIFKNNDGLLLFESIKNWLKGK